MAEVNTFEQKLFKRLAKEEGLRLKAYKPDNSEKYYTIGYGRYSKKIKEGQTITKDQADQFLKEDIDVRLKEIRKKITDFDNMPEDVRENLFSSWYRGSLPQSPKTLKLINSGKYLEASKEFLNNKEYKDRKSGAKLKLKGVLKRMENTSKSIASMEGRKIKTKKELVKAAMDNPLPSTFNNQVMTDFMSLSLIQKNREIPSVQDSSMILNNVKKDLEKSKKNVSPVEVIKKSVETLNKHKGTQGGNLPDNIVTDSVSTKQSTPVIQESVDREPSTESVSPIPSDDAGSIPRTSTNFGGSSDVQSLSLAERGFQLAKAGTEYSIDKLSNIQNIEERDIKEFGDHFVNQLTEESAVGNIIQRGIQGALTSDRIDPNFDPKKDMMYEELTKNLSNDDLETLLSEYSFNQSDFRTTAIMMNQRNKRLKEMSEYAKENPVLNASGFMGSMLTDAVVFMPVSSAIAAQGAATFTGSAISSLDKARRLGMFTLSEAVEQGGQELVWNAYKKNYEFSLPMFMAGVGLGVGTRAFIDGITDERMVKELLNNEKGFIKLTQDQAKELVSVVSKEVDDKKAIQFAKRLAQVKLETSDNIRRGLMKDFDIVHKEIEAAKLAVKAAKGTKKLKKAKGNLQRLIRKSKVLEKNIPLELRQIVDGTHPKLQSAVNPQLKSRQIAKELGIDPKTVDSPDKIREFLGLKDSKFADSIIVDGEKGYEQVLKKQIKEMTNNERLNANVFLTDVSKLMKTSPMDIEAGIGSYLQNLGNKASDFIVNQADTDSNLTKYVFNKANLVNSKNPYVSGFYNWLSPDSSGRKGMSSIRATETKAIYRNRYHGAMMENYKSNGYRLLKHLNKDKGLVDKMKVYVDFKKFENDVVPIFKDRLTLTSSEFEAKYPDVTLREIADDFAKDYNKLNKQVAEDAKAKGVIGAIEDSSENFIHRAWDSTKARLIRKEDLEEAIYQGMRTKLLDEGLPFEDSFLRTQAKNFAFGLQSKDITQNMEATQTYIESLNKFIKSAEAKGNEVVEEAVSVALSKANAQKLANELGELGKRADIDINVEIPNTNGMKLSDLMEDNFIVTQDRYNSRMAARTAAAEHGIKDIRVLDSWRADAIEAEKKRLIKSNSKHISQSVDYLDRVLKQDIKSFQYGGLGGQGDVLEAEANDAIRLLKKISVVNLMQNTGIASIAEYGGTVAEIGMYNAVKSAVDPISNMLRRNFILNSGVDNVRTITDDMAALTGIGFGNMAFSSRGVSQAEQIFRTGTLSKVESAFDAAGTLTQNTFGWVEVVGRKATSNGLAIKWGQHFKGNEPDGFIAKLLSPTKGTTNRTLENVGLGQWVEENGQYVFKTNKTYDKIKENYLKHVTFDKNDSVKAMNFDKWDVEARDSFRDVIKMQTSHIYADPDSTTAAYWQTTSLGRILNQFRTFSVNSTSKIAGFAYGNLANGIKHQDADEVLKYMNKMYWAATMGTLAVALRDEITTAGSGEKGGFEKIADAPMQAIAIGFSRSSMIGNMDTVNGIGGALFGYDNIFNQSSFTGRDKNFFNLAQTPIGQLGVNAFQGASSVIQGDLEGAADAAGNLTPFKRQLGIQQMINYLNRR